MDEYKRYGLDFWLINFVIFLILFIWKYFFDEGDKSVNYTPIIFILVVSGSVVAYKTYKWLKEPD